MGGAGLRGRAGRPEARTASWPDRCQGSKSGCSLHGSWVERPGHYRQAVHRPPADQIRVVCAGRCAANRRQVMTPASVTVRVPATTANLGPGFDSVGLALDLWNKCTFTLVENGIHVNITGEGAGRLPTNARNKMVQAFLHLYRRLGKPDP